MHPPSGNSSADRDPDRPRIPDPWTDRDIVAAIGYAMHLAIPSLKLACEAHDGIAILRGMTMDKYDRLQALDIAADIPGVQHVIDRITVSEEAASFGSRWKAKPVGSKAA